MNLLISIKPRYTHMIFFGKKRVEYRRVKPARPFGRIYVYETRPTSAVVGYMDYSIVIHGTPRDIWKNTRELSCMRMNEYMEYFSGSRQAVAFIIKDLGYYSEPRQLGTHGLPSVVPQGYIYF